VSEAAPENATVALRRALSDVAMLSGNAELGADEAAVATDIAQRVLRVDPSAVALQNVAAGLTAAAAAMTRPGAADARARLDSAALALSTAVRRVLVRAPLQLPSFVAQRLGGVMSDVARRGAPPR
jgi:hypothetical protein